MRYGNVHAERTKTINGAYKELFSYRYRRINNTKQKTTKKMAGIMKEITPAKTNSEKIIIIYMC